METTKDLLISYFRGRCTESQRTIAEAFIAADTDPELVDACIAAVYENLKPDNLIHLSEQEYANAWQQFESRSQSIRPAVPKGLIYRMKWLRYAAAVMIVSAGFGILYTLLHKGPFNNVAPAEVLAGKDAEVIHGMPGTHKRVILADGSIVYLFPGSEISVPGGYNKNDRFLALKGRAFFNIAPDAQKPFIVRTKALNTQVLGTSFEVDENNHEQVLVTVRTGMVSVNNGSKELTRLSYNQQIRYSSGSDSFAVVQVNAQKLSTWVAGELVFENTPLPDVCTTLEQWYGIKIDLQGEYLKHKKVSVKFSRQSLKTVLNVLSLTTGFKYQLNNKLVKIN